MPRGMTHTAEQVIRALRLVDEGAPVSEVCRQLGIVEKTFYRWREKYAGMDVGEAKRLRELEDENMRLKKLLAEQLLHTEVLRDVLAKKW
jgi:putative transposase